MKGTKKDWSGWYGPSGRYISKYDIHKIRESPAFTTLKAMGTRDLPSGQKMAQIRDAATIHCTQASASVGRLIPGFGLTVGTSYLTIVVLSCLAVSFILHKFQFHTLKF